MDLGLVREIGSKALLAGGGALLLYWTITAVKLVLSARGINPLIKQFFTQVAAGRVDAAYLLTTKTYRQHVNRQQFIRYLAGLKTQSLPKPQIRPSPASGRQHDPHGEADRRRQRGDAARFHLHQGGRQLEDRPHRHRQR
jgi:hypothetical protein